jgi:hypothetical protein
VSEYWRGCWFFWIFWVFIRDREGECVGRVGERTSGEACLIFGCRKCWKHSDIESLVFICPSTQKVVLWFPFCISLCLTHLQMPFKSGLPSLPIVFRGPEFSDSPYDKTTGWWSLIHHSASTGCSYLSNDYRRWFICVQYLLDLLRCNWYKEGKYEMYMINLDIRIHPWIHHYNQSVNIYFTYKTFLCSSQKWEGVCGPNNVYTCE